MIDELIFLILFRLIQLAAIYELFIDGDRSEGVEVILFPQSRFACF